MDGRGLAREEATLERLAAAPGGRALTAIYLLGAYWPWWATLAAAAFVVWRVADLPAAGAAALGLAAFSAIGWATKRAMERAYR